MEINDFFYELQKKLETFNINGDLTLHGNCIIWEYSVDYDMFVDEKYDYYDDDYESVYETPSMEENLMDIYSYDVSKIEIAMIELNEIDNWVITNPEITANTITFKIY